MKQLISTRKLGTYAGTCSECNLMRGTDDDPVCGRCGHKHETEAIARDIDGNIKEAEGESV